MMVVGVVFIVVLGGFCMVRTWRMVKVGRWVKLWMVGVVAGLFLAHTIYTEILFSKIMPELLVLFCTVQSPLVYCMRS